VRLPIRFALGALAIAAALAAAPLRAQPVDPDWPCVQRKVTRLSIAQMWTGPLPDALPPAARDGQVDALAARIAPRRTSLEEVATLVAAIGASPAAARDARLAALFAAVFEQIDRRRTRLVNGVARYARGQRVLSERIDAQESELAAREADAAPDDFDALDRIDALRDALAIQRRIYEERQASLRYVCESPVLLEQRAFAIARIVAAALEDGQADAP
jgi:hypothetical protein